MRNSMSMQLVTYKQVVCWSILTLAIWQPNKLIESNSTSWRCRNAHCSMNIPMIVSKLLQSENNIFTEDISDSQDELIL